MLHTLPSEQKVIWSLPPGDRRFVKEKGKGAQRGTDQRAKGPSQGSVLWRVGQCYPGRGRGREEHYKQWDLHAKSTPHTKEVIYLNNAKKIPRQLVPVTWLAVMMIEMVTLLLLMVTEVLVVIVMTTITVVDEHLHSNYCHHMFLTSTRADYLRFILFPGFQVTL